MADSNLVPTTTEISNLLWRSGWTFIQSFTGVLVGSSMFDWDVSTAELALAAGIGAVISVVKNFASKRLGTQ